MVNSAIFSAGGRRYGFFSLRTRRKWADVSIAPHHDCRAVPGGRDTLARILAEYMRTSLGQTVIIENVSGAGGSVGVGRVARAAPDGYTVCIGHWQTHVLNGASYQLPYDVVRDFEPVSLLADTLDCCEKDFPGKGSEGIH
jgi:hypothetical protein